MVKAFRLDARGVVAVVGTIRPGIVPFTAPWWLNVAPASPLGLLRTAAVIVPVSLLEAVSIAKALGERVGDRVDPDVEIFGASLNASQPHNHSANICASTSRDTRKNLLSLLIRANCLRTGLAASNLVGAAFGAFPSTGSFARSAVCSSSGGMTGEILPFQNS